MPHMEELSSCKKDRWFNTFALRAAPYHPGARILGLRKGILTLPSSCNLFLSLSLHIFRRASARDRKSVV